VRERERERGGEGEEREFVKIILISFLINALIALIASGVNVVGKLPLRLQFGMLESRFLIIEL